MTILSVVSVAIFNTIDQIQRSNAQIVNTVIADGELGVAATYIRSRLGRSENFDISDDDNCLRLTYIVARDRTGLRFDTDNAFIRTNYRGVNRDISRSVSFWIWIPRGHNRDETVLRWGRDTPANADFSITLTDSRVIELDSNRHEIKTDTPTALPAGRWSHVAIVYDRTLNLNSERVRFYYNTLPQPLEFASSVQVGFNTNATSTGDRVRLGQPRTGSGHFGFRGALSDVRIWSAPLTAAQVRAVAAGATDVFTGALQLRLPLAALENANRNTPDETGFSRDGTLFGFAAARPLFSTTEEDSFGEAFTLLDTRPDDGQTTYTLLHNAELATCDTDDLSGWTEITENFYVRPSDTGFFVANGTTPSAVQFRYGNKTRGDGSSPVATKRVGLSRRFENRELCRLVNDLEFNLPPGTACPIKESYAHIKEGFDPDEDELFIPDATARVAGDLTHYTSLSFLPANFAAEYHRQTGVMRIYTTDDQFAPREEWEEALQQVSYRPLRANYTSTKNLVFSLGHLPLRIGNLWHFYDYISFPDGTDVSWHVMRNRARNAYFCGATGYLASITSDVENDFLVERFRTASGGLPSGWIGGTDLGPMSSEGNFVWVDGPEDGRRFWSSDSRDGWAVYGDFNGRPVGDTWARWGRRMPTNEYRQTEVILTQTPPNALRRRQTVSTVALPLRYHNFAWREPNNVNYTGRPANDEEFLQITGNASGQGLWNDLPSPRRCTPTSHYGVCGYYIEWGGFAGQNLNAIVYDETIDVSTHKALCTTQ